MATQRPSLTRIMNDAKTRLPGALEDAIKRELFNSLHEFFQESNSWREDIEIDVTPNELSYDLTPEGGGQVHRLMKTENDAGIEIGATYPGLDMLKLGTSPSQAATYVATVALTVIDPTSRDDFPQCPDWVYDKYGSGILDGILSRMMSQPAKPYSNERLAILHMRRFSSAIAKARIEADHENLYRGQHWRYPQQFAVRRK